MYYSQEPRPKERGFPRLVEKLAQQEPDRHWVLWLYAALWSAAYVRTEHHCWQCVYAGMGFADDENAGLGQEALAKVLTEKVKSVPDPASRLNDNLPSEGTQL